MFGVVGVQPTDADMFGVVGVQPADADMFGAGGANSSSPQAQILSVNITLTCRGWIFEAASARTGSDSFSVFM